MKKIIYYMLNHFFYNSEHKTIKYVKKEKNFISFEVDCYKDLVSR